MATSRKNRSRVPRALSRKKSRKPNKSIVLSKPMKALVDKRIDGHAETKTALLQSGLVQVRAGRIVGSQLNRLVPQVPQADSGQPSDRASRIGAQIRLTSMEVEGCITFVPNANFPNAGTQLARMFAFSAKSISDWGFITGNVTTQDAIANALLRNGADIADYDGNLRAHFLPMNHKDMTSHLDRKFKINKDPKALYGTSQDGPLPVSVIPFKFRLKVKNKVLKFTDNTTNLPSNYCPLFAIGWCDPVNNPTSQPPSTSDLDYTYQVKMNFKDM